ncbi:MULTISPECIES: YcjX family protein [unclassified Aureimonas]|uniref:YcjX family protein n=1 Tax=unclassified Aureimonas TaxID=2615206 RepID=UPI0006F467AE|nr:MULTISPECIES: YcjX family protein [unclassified Aureimonas]KQT57413.1 amino acid regulated cytosolic protein [Aureimonas sp. Leaf427]KQT77092.1 amino acid regulated cytosolic protein [Aureimonas sp. Leaf460]
MTSLTDEARIAFDNIADRTGSIFRPTLRLGVAGLSRAGKTVFITSLVHNLLHGGRLPLFEAQSGGRIARSFLEEQPDAGVPRFQYEDHIRTLVEDRLWPQSTRAISELRLTIEYESASGWSRMFSAGRLSLDIVDYPGEWLLDLPLLEKDFATFSAESVARARLPSRAAMAGPYLKLLAAADLDGPADEPTAQALARAFADYLQACRADRTALSTLPPGRFLMPGDLEGSPALTFAPLPVEPGKTYAKTSLAGLMARRYEGYKSVVVKPFFRDHFARLDRQILLVDVMQAINAGPEAMADLETALVDILACFRPGRATWLGAVLGRRIDRILFAATKADHLHRESHLRLEAIVKRLVDDAVKRARFSGAETETLAMAAIRATREATVEDHGDKLPVIVGTPIAGETIAGESFDGKRETAIFPGDLPSDPARLFKLDAAPDPITFVRFRPPKLERTAEGLTLSLPHIRLDRALQFLIGDRLA